MVAGISANTCTLYYGLYSPILAIYFSGNTVIVKSD